MMGRPSARALLAATAFAATLALAGCAGAPFTFARSGGVEARHMVTLGWALIALMSFLVLGMLVLVVWGALRKRGSFEEHLPIDAGGGRQWIVIGGLAVPGVVLGALFLLTVAELGARPTGFAAARIKIHVTAHQWWWQFDYDGTPRDQSRGFETANEIHVPVDTPVGVEVTSADVIHSFWAPRLFGKLDAIPGHTNYFVFQADKPGVYLGECGEYCGVQHANMQFTVVAEKPQEYAAWVARQRRPAMTPTDPELVGGRHAFEEYACALCHRIRGTRGRGGVAPDLTHVGSRLEIGAGALRNTRARMQAWIVNSQALKPGNKMPVLSQLDGRTLRELSAYLESLK